MRQIFVYLISNICGLFVFTPLCRAPQSSQNCHPPCLASAQCVASRGQVRAGSCRSLSGARAQQAGHGESHRVPALQHSHRPLFRFRGHEPVSGAVQIFDLTRRRWVIKLMLSLCAYIYIYNSLQTCDFYVVGVHCNLDYIIYSVSETVLLPVYTCIVTYFSCSLCLFLG